MLEINISNVKAYPANVKATRTISVIRHIILVALTEQDI